MSPAVGQPILCDWCEAQAAHEDTSDRREDGQQYSCEAHKRALERLVTARIWRSGNPFAGENIDGIVRPIEG